MNENLEPSSSNSDQSSVASHSCTEGNSIEKKKAVRLPWEQFSQKLFDYLSHELGVTALETQLRDIAEIVAPYQYPYKIDEQHLQEADDMDDDFTIDDWMETETEREEERRAEIAATCSCGAWKFGGGGRILHVADCYCGAE